MERKTTRREFLKFSSQAGLVTALSGGCWSGGGAAPANREPINIILLTLDTTRVDHLSCYGYPRRTSPNLDALAEQSVVYTRAIAPSSWTLPSHASLFTGKFTASHGARYDPNGPMMLTSAIPGPSGWNRYRARGLSPDEQTLAEILNQADFTTGAVVGGPWLKKPFGLNKGFEYYDDAGIDSVNGRRADPITESALRWLDEVRDEQFFLFLNYFDPHEPFAAPGQFALAFQNEKMAAGGENAMIEEIHAQYDAEILYMDYHIGRLLRSLASWGRYDNTWIIVTADHGQLLGEHGKHGHGKYLYQEELHVPLFMKYPRSEVAPTQSDVCVQLTDILPSICHRLELSTPQGIQGSLLHQVEHPIIAETYPLEFTTEDGHWRAIFQDDYKFLWNSEHRHMLFDLAADPKESNNLVRQQPQRAKRMIAELNNYVEGLPAPDTAAPDQVIDQETLDALKGLGYVK